MPRPTKNKKATVWVTAGIFAIGLLIMGLLGLQEPRIRMPADPQSGINDADLWVAASISNETLLLLLAVGIAGVLGLSRKNKNIQKGIRRSKPDDSSDF